MKDSLNFTDKSNEITLTVRSNPFKAGSFIGSVPRQTINLNTLAKRIRENDTGLSDYTIFNVAGQLKKETIKSLQRGQAVNLLGLGTLYLIPDGSLSSSDSQEALSKKLTLRFKPSEEAVASVGNVRVNLVKVIDIEPNILRLESIPHSDTEGEFTIGKMVHISGERLKVAGEGSGIYLIRTDENGNPADSNPVKISDELIVRNKLRELEFFIPAGLEAGNYRIRIATRYVASGPERKSLVSCMSEVITIRE